MPEQDNTQYLQIDRMRLEELSNSILRVYYALENYDDTLITAELDELCTNQAMLMSVLSNPKDYSTQIMLLARMLNTETSDKVEILRKRTLSDLLELAQISDFQHADVLLPPQEKLKLMDSIAEFYSEYDPNDFRNSELGYGQTDPSAINAMTHRLDYHHLNTDIIFRDLHSITVNEQAPDLKQRQAWALIYDMREYYDDPVTDTIRVAYAVPMKDAEYRTIQNSLAGLNSLHGKPLSFKDLGSGLVAAIEKNAKIEGKPKCRRIIKYNGEKGVARGNIIFFATDNKGNMVNMDNEQLDIISHFYQHAQMFKDDNAMPISNIKAHETISKLVKTLLMTGGGNEVLRASGLTALEIDQYAKLNLK